MKETVDVCIVGGGVVGLFVGLELVSSGLSVRLVDKVYTGSSRFNIGDVSLHGHPVRLSEFMRFTRQAWGDAAEQFGTNMGVETCGGATLAITSADVQRLQQEIEIDKQNGFHTEWLEGADAVNSFLGEAPFVENHVLGAKISADDMVINSKQALDALRGELVRRGVRIWGNDLVTGFIMSGDSVQGVRTAAGDECIAQHTVVASGVWANYVLGKAGVVVPMRPARAHLLELSPTGRVPRKLVRYHMPQGEFIFKYQNDGRMLMCYTGRHDQAQATWRTTPDPDAVHWMLEQAPALLHGLRFPKVQKMSAITLAITPNQLPAVGHFPNLKGLLAAVGCNGHSYAYAAGIAKLVHHMVTGQTPQIDLSALEPALVTNNAADTAAERIGVKKNDSEPQLIVSGHKPSPDVEASLHVGAKPSPDAEVSLHVGAKPAADSSETTLVVDSAWQPEKPPVATLHVGAKPSPDVEVTLHSAAASAPVPESQKVAASAEELHTPERLQPAPEPHLVVTGEKPNGEVAQLVTEGAATALGAGVGLQPVGYVAEQGSALGQGEDNTETGGYVATAGTALGQQKVEQGQIISDDNRSMAEREAAWQARHSSQLVYETSASVDAPAFAGVPTAIHPEHVNETNASKVFEDNVAVAQPLRQTAAHPETQEEEQHEAALQAGVEFRRKLTEDQEKQRQQLAVEEDEARLRIAAAKKSAKQKQQEEENKRKEAARVQILKARQAAKEQG